MPLPRFTSHSRGREKKGTSSTQDPTKIKKRKGIQKKLGNYQKASTLEKKTKEKGQRRRKKPTGKFPPLAPQEKTPDDDRPHRGV